MGIVSYIAEMGVATISVVPGGLAVMIVALTVAESVLSPSLPLYRVISYGYGFIATLGWVAWTAHWNQTRRHSASQARKTKTP